MGATQLALAASVALLILFVALFVVEKRRRNKTENRFRNVVDADEEARRVLAAANAEAERTRHDATEESVRVRRLADEEAQNTRRAAGSARARIDAEAKQSRIQLDRAKADLDKLRIDYAEKKVIYDRLQKEVAIFDDKLAFAEMGIYQPHFDFTDSEQYKSAISTVSEQQKQLITANRAVTCTKTWTVDGSTAKGQTMTNRNIKLTLRAFNGECDAAVSNIRWNNAQAMEKRIVKAQEQIDKLNASNSTFVTKEYLDLKLRELFLTHEYREKLKTEKEERAEAARQAKEEQKFQRDMERAQEDEERYQRLLDKAKAEAARISGPKLDAFTDQIKTLERDLAAARAKFERAQAMAEKTRSGYVYIISNMGSFGADVVKIGLTRRLDPADRIRELGDASVPFIFDTHAVIYSEDSPALERALHSEFESVRVNAQNYRKEFFRVSIDDVEAAVKRLAPDAPFFKDVEAQDYRETLARRNARLQAADAAAVAMADALPATI